MKILFTGYYFDTYSGSQMYITEMAQYLRGKGHKITIASPNITEEIVNDVKKYDITLIEPQDVNVTECYDIVFAVHHPIINDLLERNLKYKKIINICLGTYHPLEEPVYFYKKIDLFIANSAETKQKLISKNKIKEERIFVLPNFLPDNFANYNFDKSDILKRIAIISNHVPQELKDIQSNLNDIAVDYYGIEYEQEKVTPELLSKYDAIVTIGKTVQYALGMEIPVYEYDMFGGCGYITPDNYEKEKDFNFSGRATNRQISTREISQEIVSNYKNAKENAPILKSKSIADFSFANIDKLMKVIDELPYTKKVKPKREHLKLFYKKVKGKIFSVNKYNNKTLKVVTLLGISFIIRKKPKEADENSEFPIRLTDKEKIKIIERITTAKNYLEFGAGGSTFLALLNSEAKITSVESSQEWINHICQWDIIKDGNASGRLNILHVDIGETQEWGFPKDDSSKHLFPNYSAQAFSSNNNYDVIFIDGRFRVACVLMAIKHCPRSIIMVHDYPKRKEYHIIGEFLDTTDSVGALKIFKVKKDINVDRLNSLYEDYKYISD